MLLVFFRHGIAEPGAAGMPDRDRALTPRGIQRTRLAAKGLARIAQRPQVILTSPKTRAVQTADLLGRSLDLVPERIEALAADDARAILRMLGRREEASLVLVGHEPTLSRSIELLCYGKATGATQLKKAGAAGVETDASARRGTLQWLLPPRLLRKLAR